MSHNRLASESSPYLIQHKDNPVHWWPWGAEALAKAKRTGKPILLSVGYAACHWCHVMAHESFEDEATAGLMNDLYVNIKVDREERPDIDAIYMSALHALGEQGGWPLTMFLTPSAEPFWGGTYFPPDDRYGRPSFKRVLTEIARIHAAEPDRAAKNAEAILERLNAERPPLKRAEISETAFKDLALRMAEMVDPVHGGLQGAPKFPQFSFFWLLWRCAMRFDLAPARVAVLTTLRNICQGGIYDHIGGGFARYSVDERWLVPHFEKMLYDNALLIELLVEAWRETQEPLFAQRIEETIAWLAREMQTPEGGLASSYDADSEGEEGKFAVWTPDEVKAVLGETDGALFCGLYDITQAGNFEGHSIPNRLQKLELENSETEQRLIGMQAKLFAARKTRVPPGWDDKVLADWNGLAIIALTHAADAFQQPKWLELAQRAYSFIRGHMTRDGRLLHASRGGIAKAPATASDYANMIGAALALFQSTGEASLLEDAKGWVAVLDAHHWVEISGGYAMAADDTEGLIVRTQTAHDDATPNANGVMISNLMALRLFTGEDRYRSRAEQTFAAYAGDVSRAAIGHTGMLSGALDILAPMHAVVLHAAGAEREADALHVALQSVSLPGAVRQRIADATHVPTGSPIKGKTTARSSAVVMICVGPQCSLPLSDAGLVPDAARRLRQASDMRTGLRLSQG